MAPVPSREIGLELQPESMRDVEVVVLNSSLCPTIHLLLDLVGRDLMMGLGQYL